MHLCTCLVIGNGDIISCYRQQLPDLILYMRSHGRLKLPSGCFSVTVSTLCLPAHGLWDVPVFVFGLSVAAQMRREHILSPASLETALIKQVLACRWKDCVCVCVCAPVPFNQLTFRSCMRMGNCVVCMFASESVPVGICAYMCLCVPAPNNKCMPCMNLYAWIWLCMCVCVPP